MLFSFFFPPFLFLLFSVGLGGIIVRSFALLWFSFAMWSYRCYIMIAFFFFFFYKVHTRNHQGRKYVGFVREKLAFMYLVSVPLEEAARMAIM